MYDDVKNWISDDVGKHKEIAAKKWSTLHRDEVSVAICSLLFSPDGGACPKVFQLIQTISRYSIYLILSLR